MRQFPCLTFGRMLSLCTHPSLLQHPPSFPPHFKTAAQYFDKTEPRDRTFRLTLPFNFALRSSGTNELSLSPPLRPSRSKGMTEPRFGKREIYRQALPHKLHAGCTKRLVLGSEGVCASLDGARYSRNLAQIINGRPVVSLFVFSGTPQKLEERDS